jgi:hypothetical protein
MKLTIVFRGDGPFECEVTDHDAKQVRTIKFETVEDLMSKLSPCLKARIETRFFPPTKAFYDVMKARELEQN